MSFSNAPDAITLGRVAGALAVDEAFVEKDWFVVQAIAVLVAVGGEDIVPVFSGGTSLLKGYGLIKRFSEDIDFKLNLSAAFAELSGGQRRRALGPTCTECGHLGEIGAHVLPVMAQACGQHLPLGLQRVLREALAQPRPLCRIGQGAHHVGVAAQALAARVFVDGGFELGGQFEAGGNGGGHGGLLLLQGSQF